MTEKDRGQGDMPEKNRLLDCRLKADRENEKLEIGDMRSEVSEKQAEAV
jgi:hypothetical protein